MSRLCFLPATLVVICCLLIVHCVRVCEAPRVPALPALGASSSTTSFDDVLKKATKEVVEGNIGPRTPNDPYTVAQHKRDLAQTIAQRLQHVRGADGMHKVLELKLAFAVLVWERNFPPEYAHYCSYGNAAHLHLNGPNIQLPYMGAEWGAVPFSEGAASSKAVPGFPKPCKYGGSAFTLARMRNGDVMSCMVFYAPLAFGAPTQADQKVKDRVSAFNQAIDVCTMAEGANPSIGDTPTVHRVDLDRWARCIHCLSGSYLRNGVKLRGVAVILLFHPHHFHPDQNQPDSIAELHQDFGMFAPQGALLMNAVELRFQGGGGTSTAIAVIVSSIGNLHLRPMAPDPAQEGS